MKIKRLAPLLVMLALGVGLSGCYGLSGFSFSRYSTKPGSGEKSKTTLRLIGQPMLSNPSKDFYEVPHKDVPFVAVVLPSGVNDARALKVLGGRSDTAGRFGPKGGRKLTRDTDLEDTFAGGNCGGRDFGNPQDNNLRVYSVNSKVDDHGKVGTLVRSTLRLQQTDKVVVSDGIFVGVGGWSDFDKDGVPDGPAGFAEEVSCVATAFATPHLAGKNVTIRPQAVKRAARARQGG